MQAACVKHTRRRNIHNCARRFSAALAPHKVRRVTVPETLMQIAALAAAAASALAFFAFAPPAFAVDDEDIACGMSRPVTARLVADAGELKALGGRSDALIGNLSYLREPQEEAEAASGTVLFFKRTDGWRAIVPVNWENEVGVFTAATGIVIVTQRQAGDPGQSFTVVKTTDDFASSTCAELPFRFINETTWNGEFYSVKSFNLDVRGRGSLVASAETNRDGEAPRTIWASYATRDGGRTFRAPRRHASEPKAPTGIYTPATMTDAPALVAELRAYSAGK